MCCCCVALNDGKSLGEASAAEREEGKHLRWSLTSLMLEIPNLQPTRRKEFARGLHSRRCRSPGSSWGRMFVRWLLQSSPGMLESSWPPWTPHSRHLRGWICMSGILLAASGKGKEPPCSCPWSALGEEGAACPPQSLLPNPTAGD